MTHDAKWGGLRSWVALGGDWIRRSRMALRQSARGDGKWRPTSLSGSSWAFIWIVFDSERFHLYWKMSVTRMVCLRIRTEVHK